MLKCKRLLTDAEMQEFIKIRETKGDKAAAKYMASLDLFIEVKDK